MKEKHKIYIFSVLCHGVAAGIAFLISHLIKLAWPEFGSGFSPSMMAFFFLVFWGAGFIWFPFLNPYEPAYQYFFKGGRDKKQ